MNLVDIGHTIVRLDAVDSTNKYAANWLNQSIVAEGTVIMARSQWQGKGQRGNVWESEPGLNLTISIILRPSFLPLEKAYLLTHLGALAVRSALEKLGIAALVKWPNDVVYAHRKIAGILVENGISQGQIKYSVMGIGLNVNQTRFSNAIVATSIKHETGKTFDPEEILTVLLRELQRCYQLLYLHKYELLHEEYIKHLYLLHVKKTYVYNGIEINAAITGVGNDGKLLLETENGQITADLKEISLQNSP